MTNLGPRLRWLRDPRLVMRDLGPVPGEVAVLDGQVRLNAARSHVLGVPPNALARMPKEPGEVVPLLALHTPGLPLDHPVDVANGLPIRQLLGTELLAFLAQVTGMAGAREALIRPHAPAAPAEVA